MQPCTCQDLMVCATAVGLLCGVIALLTKLLHKRYSDTPPPTRPPRRRRKRQ